jgi:hypothetical protein
MSRGRGVSSNRWGNSTKWSSPDTWYDDEMLCQEILNDLEEMFGLMQYAVPKGVVYHERLYTDVDNV